QSGVRDVPTALRVNLVAINGIGPQKAAQLRYGAEQLLAECDAAFAAGRSREGAEFAKRVDSVRTQAEKAGEEQRAALAAIDAAIAAHHDAERLAARVTLLGFLRGDQISGLNAERMARAFPMPDSSSYVGAPAPGAMREATAGGLPPK